MHRILIIYTYYLLYRILKRSNSSLQRYKRRRYVSLKFSIKGVKVYNEDETVSPLILVYFLFKSIF